MWEEVYGVCEYGVIVLCFWVFDMTRKYFFTTNICDDQGNTYVAGDCDYDVDDDDVMLQQLNE